MLALLLGLTACAPADAPPLSSTDETASVDGSRAEQGAGSDGAEAPLGESVTEEIFVDAAEAAGLDFVHVNGMSGEHYFVEMMGSGAALFDYDADGDLDLYLVQGHPLVKGAVNDGADPAYADRLYRNDTLRGSPDDARIRFEDVTEASGIEALGYGMGAAAGDVDNDGHVDLFVYNWGRDELWRNRGDGTFENVSAASGIDGEAWSSGASFLDYDRDGWLDLMVVRYVEFRLENHTLCHSPQTGDPDYCGPQVYEGVFDSLYRNRGDGTFEDVTLQMGMGEAKGPALAVSAGDFNDDGWSDLYVANDGVENHLWINREGQRFENAGPFSGTAVNQAGMAEASMGIGAEDYDEDGDLDLFVTHLSNETNTFYRNEGDTVFSDRTGPSGLGQASLVSTGFGLASLDYDRDGWLDLFVANGAVIEIYEQSVAGVALPLEQRNQLFRGLGGARFEEVSEAAGQVFAVPGVHRGVAAGDLDDDGDTDLVVSRNRDRPLLLENRHPRPGGWIGIDARTGSEQGMRPHLGASVTLRAGERSWLRRSRTDGSYASSSDPRILAGLGEAQGPVEAEVLWPDGSRETFSGLSAGRYHRIVQGRAGASP